MHLVCILLALDFYQHPEEIPEQKGKRAGSHFSEQSAPVRMRNCVLTCVSDCSSSLIGRKPCSCRDRLQGRVVFP